MEAGQLATCLVLIFAVAGLLASDPHWGQSRTIQVTGLLIMNLIEVTILGKTYHSLYIYICIYTYTHYGNLI